MLRVLGAFAVVCGLFLLLAKSCESEVELASPVSQQHVIGNMGWKDTLFLSASFSECGEWGGHRELIKIYLRADTLPKAGMEWSKWRKGALTAAFWLDTIGCSKPDRKFFFTEQRLMSQADEKAVIDYLQQLVVHGFEERYPSQTGHVYHAWMADKTLEEYFYDTKEGWQGFNELRGQLFNTTKHP